MTQPTPPPVTDDDLWAVPLEHRQTIARWLAQRAASFEPSFFLSDRAAEAIRDAVRGAAVDLMSPGVDDTTIGHAQAVLGSLALPDPRACDRHRTAGGHVPSCRYCREGVAGPSCALASDGEHDCTDLTREAECRPPLPQAKPRHPNNIFDGDEIPRCTCAEPSGLSGCNAHWPEVVRDLAGPTR